MAIWPKRGSLSRTVETAKRLSSLKAVLVLWRYKHPEIVPAVTNPKSSPSDRLSSRPNLSKKYSRFTALAIAMLTLVAPAPRQHLLEMYGYSLSDSELTAITDKVIPAMREWQNRPLESLYTLVWLDGIYYKVRQDGKVVTRVLYSVMGLSLSGKKQVLGIYTGVIASKVKLTQQRN